MESAQNVAKLLGVTQAELARLVSAAGNAPDVNPPARKVDQGLPVVIRIIATAAEMTGDGNRAAIWFKHQPLPGWAGKTAFDLVSEGKADRVLAYLEAVRSGAYI